MTDKTTKVLLAAIALGLWANAFTPTARAQQPFGFSNDPMVMLAHDVNQLVNGTCANTLLCSRMMR
jgi:hypothetical protein